MLVDAAAAGARYGTMRDRTPQEGMERTRQMIEGFFRLPMLRIFRTIRVVILRGAHLGGDGEVAFAGAGARGVFRIPLR